MAPPPGGRARHGPGGRGPRRRIRRPAVERPVGRDRARSVLPRLSGPLHVALARGPSARTRSRATPRQARDLPVEGDHGCVRSSGDRSRTAPPGSVGRADAHLRGARGSGGSTSLRDRTALRVVLRDAGTAQEPPACPRGVPTGRSPRPGAGAGRSAGMERGPLGRHGVPGGTRSSPRLRSSRRPGRPVCRRVRGGLPEPRRRVRTAGPGGDGARRAGRDFGRHRDRGSGG